MIGVERSRADAPNAPLELRQQAYMTLIPFDGNKPRAESDVPMYQLIPMLATVADPFARANEFAEVFCAGALGKSGGCGLGWPAASSRRRTAGDCPGCPRTLGL